MNSYEELEVWQKAVTLATKLYRTTGAFPSTERFGLTSQIRRATVSIPANIAEGWGRGSTAPEPRPLTPSSLPGRIP